MRHGSLGYIGVLAAIPATIAFSPTLAAGQAKKPAATRSEDVHESVDRVRSHDEDQGTGV